ncbi:MAG: site-2 protease family protein [Bacilli bacterium]|nr:site-2 protease family protein [Bacilli bacterium]
MQIITTIIVMLVLLGILVSTHELGHLLVAKAYNVYCLEYSIGMGPKIWSKKSKNGETEYSLRALPLGGYVAMYGEGVELPEGQKAGPERSLNGIKWWKRCLVMLAGISMNLITAILFSFTYALCFPSYYSASYFDTGINESANISTVQEETTARAYSLWIKGSIGEYKLDYDIARLYSPAIAISEDGRTMGYIIDCDTDINGEQYVAVFNLTSVVNANNVFTNTTFYRPRQGFNQTQVQKELCLDAKPSLEDGAYTPKAGDVIKLTPTFIKVSTKKNNPTREEFQASKANEKEVVATVDQNGSLISESVLNVHLYQYWAPIGERFHNGAKQFTNLFVSIGQGFQSLFTGHIENLGSIVAAGSMVNTISNEIGWIQTFFFFGGFLALNLALFNLLPFPGLDGYQLLVCLIETVFRKKIPEKVKNTISAVGVFILLSFSVLIILRDIVRLF